MLKQIGQTDIYLLDQMMRGRIQTDMRILDAGFGNGRNAELLVRQGFDIYGVDSSREVVEKTQQKALEWNPDFDTSRFKVAHLAQLPFPDDHFHFIICSAVLHFAEGNIHFESMFRELLRVLNSKGILWIRITTLHTMEKFAQPQLDGVYTLPDGSSRFLLTKEKLDKIMHMYQLDFVDPFKTVNVADERAMATIVLRKN